MKNKKGIFFGIIASLLIANTVFAQQSDHQTKTSFETKYQRIEASLKSALTVKTVDSLKKEIVFLDDEYFNHSELLDNALYPQTYKGEISDLQSMANTAEQRLLIIENQNERLVQLGKEVASYKSEIVFLNTRADSLNKAIENSQASEERLAALVKRYRENLELRDELIMDVVDSLMITYKGMTTKNVYEISKQIESGRISGSNPLDLMDNILAENIEYVSSSNQALSVEDHLRMYAVQQHFEDVWTQIGPKMITAYGGTKKSEWNAEIESKLKDWRMLTSQKMWNSMNKYLEFSNVELGAFDNNYSFFIALDNFVKEAQKKSEDEIISTESYQDYKKFQEFWSGKVKNEWSNLIQNTDVLTVAQISSIDDQLSSWETESRPIHPFLIVLLVLTAVSIGGYILAMAKTRKI